MRRLAILCFVFALVAAFLGFAGLAGEFVGVAKVFFFVFLALGVLFVMGHVLQRRSAWY